MRDQRKEERKKLIAFTPVYDSRQNVLLGYLRDLTLQGAMMAGEERLEIGSRVSLAIDFPETEELAAMRLVIPARVAWCRPEEDAPYLNTGFEFQEVSAQNKKVIEAVVERYQFHRDMPK